MVSILDITAIDRELSQLEGQSSRCASELMSCSGDRSSLKIQAEKIAKAQAVIQEVARITQEQLEYRLSELASLAMESVFPDPYKLKIKFENQRGRTVAKILFIDRDGNEVETDGESTGCGAIDVASLALRLSLICASKPRPRPVVLLDEPFRFIHGTDLQFKTCQMLKEIATRLKIQFIIVTGEEFLMDAADRIFKVTQSRRISAVEVIDPRPTTPKTTQNDSKIGHCRNPDTLPSPLLSPNPVNSSNGLKRRRLD